jgi:hypothetical protein
VRGVRVAGRGRSRYVTTTLIQTLGIVLFTGLVLGAAAMILDHVKESSRRRDREIVRRIQRYLDALPPARPW